MQIFSDIFLKFYHKVNLVFDQPNLFLLLFGAVQELLSVSCIEYMERLAHDLKKL